MRLKLERPRLTSVEPQQTGWMVTIGEAMAGATKPLIVARNIVAPGRTSITIPFDDPSAQHWLTDPDIGDRLLVVTGLGPARGLIKAQDFVELRALATAQGIAIVPFVDDLKAELSADKVIVARPGGLTLSDAAAPQQEKSTRALTFDTKLWGIDRDADYSKRQFELVRAAADAPFTQRTAARLDLARFYFSRQMYPEAKAVLDTAIADDRPTAEEPAPLVLRAVANIMLGRIDAAQKDLANPVVGNQNDAPLWRALAFARQGKWAEARDALPPCRGRDRHAAARIAAHRAEGCAARRDRGRRLRRRRQPAQRFQDHRSVGRGGADRVGADRPHGAKASAACRTRSPPIALRRRRATARPRRRGGCARSRSAIRSARPRRPTSSASSKTLTTAWRGDETEVEALQTLARLYTEEDRYRDAFQVMRMALTAYPHSELTRSIQSAAAKTFDTLFLAGKGDALPAIDALSLFYDFRDLTPIGRRGDEMIRRLADRLVSVDLLDQAAELLQYQVDNRLQGAARAQVATRLAVIYLMNHKPDKAQAALRATRTADLSNEIRIPRLMIEARALSDIGRHDFALEVIDGIEGRESLRLRADIHWAARRWQKAAEHIELLYGDRWKSFEPLTDARARRHAARRRRLFAGRGQDRHGAAAREIRGQDGAGAGRPRLRRGHRRARPQQRRNSARWRASSRPATRSSGFLRDLQGALSGDAGPDAGGGGAAGGDCAQGIDRRPRADRLDPAQGIAARLGELKRHCL